MMQGPLHGLRIIELAGVGPAPFAAMMLADHGAEVIRVERAGGFNVPPGPIDRGRTTIRLDLKRDPAKHAFLKLVESADGLIDPYRPGRIEALGLGPAQLHGVNSKLVIGRITGWGQHGPLSQQAGHDINYLALSGLLHGMGSADRRPLPPANLVADYGGGAMMLAFGMLAALLEVRNGADQGRVVDAAMSEGAALLGSFLYGLKNLGLWTDEREASLLNGGMALYGTYRCSDGKYLSVGAIEPQFVKSFLSGIGLSEDPLFINILDPELWEDQAEAVAERIGAEPRSHWLSVFDGKDACVAPVLKMSKAAQHPHHAARGAFVDQAGGPVPAPVPRYDEEALPLPPLRKVERDAEVALLESLGLDEEAIAQALGD
ncbi:CaiB/BaiF CoA transferase family protein [Sphingomicrobium sediminis]|uniref:CoA transferase n=1 Tax=Sphingomicrobium sediminis TaxID=2950949 RepID=A0A9X2EJM9_9SPHN|nr:CaiB/BaiF CoA-transferase family protein [Sphingomicrobium sediminis]MCM8556574.1 CoA transferase [Sphingomicrobium sediminis]